MAGPLPHHHATLISRQRNVVFVVVERRRRDKINTWISHLAELVPECSSDIKLTEVGTTYMCRVMLLLLKL